VWTSPPRCGVGHLLIVHFAQVIGANVNHLLYRGAGPAMTEVVAGVLPLSDSLLSAAGHIRNGAVRATAMASATRHPVFPDVPTFHEEGVDLISNIWFAISAPAGTPAAIVARLNAKVRVVLARAEGRARSDELGTTTGDLDPEGYARFVAAEVARWQPMIRASGATLD
jgi:tripartite-type tricarboxylate transporter receptor subunit TctC